jgi:hypothetical protein
MGNENKVRGGFEMFTNMQAGGDIIRLISGKSKVPTSEQKIEKSFLTMIEDSYNKIISAESDSLDDKNASLPVGIQIEIEEQEDIDNSEMDPFN